MSYLYQPSAGIAAVLSTATSVGRIGGKGGIMKFSKYIMMSPWDRPDTFYWELPIAWDAQGRVTHTTRKPAFISAHKTVPHSTAEGIIVCVRKMEINN